ncbi:MAG: polyprenyl diphosphate synthase [Clostridia bacterium]
MTPSHIAFIMDGNGRWAKLRGLPRKEGHKEGLETVHKVIDNCLEFGIKYVSLFVFSTENWKRPKTEVDGLFSLACRYLDSFNDESGKIRIIFTGSYNSLPQTLVNKINKTVENTCNNNDITVNLCLNYGGRAEIVETANKFIQLGKRVSEKQFTQTILNELPEIDFVVRTGGQMRLSNFMLYSCAYAELYFTDCLWPDFDKQQLCTALEIYRKRIRNFGGVKE